MTARRFARFLTYVCVGAAGTAVQYGVMAVLVPTHVLDAVVASGLGATAGAIVNYLLNYHVTFRSDNAHRATAPKFFAVAAAAVGLNSVLMAVFTHRLNLPWLVAQCATTACVLALTYSVNSVWAFRSAGRNA